MMDPYICGLHFFSPTNTFILTCIPAWISGHMPSKVWDEIIYPFPNFNGCTVEVWEWISNFIPHFMMYITTYPSLWDCHVIMGITSHCVIQYIPWNIKQFGCASLYFGYCIVFMYACDSYIYILQGCFTWAVIWILPHGANMGPIWGRQDPGGPMLAPWTLLSGPSPVSQHQTTVKCKLGAI